MGSFGVSRPKRKKHNYRFVPRPKKEQIPTSLEEVTETDSVAKPKRKTAAKTATKTAAKTTKTKKSEE